MTAVASPPSVQPLPRLGWNSSKNNQGALDTTNAAGEVSRIFGARKGPQRANSASSVSTLLSLSSTQNGATSSPATSVDDSEINTKSGLGPEQQQDTTSTKSGRTLWTPQKSEATVAASNGRPPAVPPLSNSTPQFTDRQTQAIGFAQQNNANRMQQPQQQQMNGRAAPPGQGNNEPPAMLVLLPMNGTFERKQITVPYFPDILRIGRQTNAKTVPTPANGYFDSKVLSRQHAEVWADRSGKIWIRDVKSSNGTFVNGVRLSPESRDSEPHELRDNDMLELGIDIVSEDQKSIVHHKVSAKIEHAGIQANTSSVLDLNLGDIDPSSGGGGMIGGMLPQQHMRGRGGSQGSIASSGRMSTQSMGGVNGVGVQRHMNAWLSPVSIEQVVKRLGNELRQAKQQAQDLHRTSDFFQAVLKTAPGQELPKAPPSMIPPKQQQNGNSPIRKSDILHSPFSQPPAPPPSQPLPEKPDTAPHQLPFRRAEQDKQSPKLPHAASPSKLGEATNSSQILNLAESLAAARKELEHSSSRITQLEEMLKEERRMREEAEARARQLMEKASPAEDARAATLLSGGFTAADISSEPITKGDDAAETASIASTSSEATIILGETLSKEKPAPPTLEEVREDAASLQERLTLALAAMEETQTQMERYKRRAEAAEEERGGLADMVARIRQEAQLANAAAASKSLKSIKKASGATDSISIGLDSKSIPSLPNGTALTKSSASKGDGEDSALDHAVAIPNGSAHPHLKNHESSKKDADADAMEALEQVRLLQGAMVSAMEKNGQSGLAQAAPYASIVGVVLLGVGIMAYLNGWQKVER